MGLGAAGVAPSPVTDEVPLVTDTVPPDSVEVPPDSVVKVDPAPVAVPSPTPPVAAPVDAPVFAADPRAPPATPAFEDAPGTPRPEFVGADPPDSCALELRPPSLEPIDAPAPSLAYAPPEETTFPEPMDSVLVSTGRFKRMWIRSALPATRATVEERSPGATA